MKDAFGHGSGGRGVSAVTRQLASRASMFGGGFQSMRPVTSNEEAAQALMSTLKSTQAPTHEGFGGYNTPSARPAGQSIVNQMRGGGKSWGNLRIRGVNQ